MTANEAWITGRTGETFHGVTGRKTTCNRYVVRSPAGVLNGELTTAEAAIAAGKRPCKPCHEGLGEHQKPMARRHP